MSPGFYPERNNLLGIKRTTKTTISLNSRLCSFYDLLDFISLMSFSRVLMLRATSSSETS